MGRRTRMRQVKRTPRNFYFTRKDQDLNSVDITVAEFEAMRLKHYLGMNQQTSAEKMNISKNRMVYSDELQQILEPDMPLYKDLQEISQRTKNDKIELFSHEEVWDR